MPIVNETVTLDNDELIAELEELAAGRAAIRQGEAEQVHPALTDGSTD